MTIRSFGITMVGINLVPIAMMFWLGSSVDAFTIAIINIVFLTVISLTAPRTNDKALILSLLSLKGGLTGQQLVKSSGGTLRRSSVYVHIGQLIEKDAIRAKVTTGPLGIEQHRFYIHDKGEQ